MQHKGYRTEDWNRWVLYDSCFRFLKALPLENFDALEIAPGPRWKTLGFRSYTAVDYPDFDICIHTLPQRFDIIIADQVFEHLLWPYRAARNVLQMLKPGGYFVICTPFLVGVHNYPVDCSRWTETGLRYFLAECGFDLNSIQTGSWGNLACIRTDFKENKKHQQWAKKGWFSSLKNDPDFPVTVWAFARNSHPQSGDL